MGTRNLTLVSVDNEYKVAQYGQWDGNPSATGNEILEFLKSLNGDFSGLKLATTKTKILSEEEVEKIKDIPEWHKVYPQYSRDMGAKILPFVLDHKDDDEIILNLFSEFASDSLFCEWAYVVDLDKNTFEVYEGFNKTPLAENERFFYLQEADMEYYPVKWLATFPLGDLPESLDHLE